MADKKRIDELTGVSTAGHEWDGIEELDNPMPRWWLWSFYACIAWGVVYVALFPAWPLVSRATQGLLGWSSHGQLERELAAERIKKAPVRAAIERAPLERIADDPALFEAAVEGGRSAFKVHCVQCHGSGAAGGKGYPNLNDDDWLWGGNIAEIHYTITHGVRNPDHAKTRLSQMPAFGRDQMLESGQIGDIVAHVRVISKQGKASPASLRGAALFADNCAACHGADGTGNRQFGAPNLTDAIWLYGGDPDTLTATVNNARYGVMPAWGTRLDPVTIKMLAVYVHSLGGGEATPGKAMPNPGPARKAIEDVKD